MTTPLRKLVSRNIRHLRNRDELRVVDIAEAVEVTPRQVQDWISDREWGSNPSDENLAKLARLFKVSAGYFYDDNKESRGA
jgi:transcriptional regulator with XRE-family HTH domain